MLEEPERTSSDYRDDSGEAVDQLDFIRDAQAS